MITLEQSSAFTPLMRHLRILGKVAFRARNYDVIYVVKPTSTKRNHMINMVMLVQLAIAIIATTLLSFYLQSYVFKFEIPRDLLTLPSRSFSEIVSAHVFIVNCAFLLSVFWVCHITRKPDRAFAANLIFVCLVVFLGYFMHAIPVIGVPLGNTCVPAGLAFTRKSYCWFSAVSNEFPKWMPMITATANLTVLNGDVQHSVSLSLSPVMCVVRAVGLTASLGATLGYAYEYTVIARRAQ